MSMKKRFLYFTPYIVAIVIAAVILSVFEVAQDMVDDRARRCDELERKLQDPNITIGQIELLRIKYDECYPSEWAWPGLLQPSKDR